MLLLIKNFLAARWLNLLQLLAIVLPIVYALLKARKSGISSERNKIEREVKDNVTKAKTIENTVKRIPDGDASKQLFKKWKRK